MSDSFSDSIDEDRRRQFESAWAAGQPVAIEQCLPDETDPMFSATLEELVQIDLEFRWRGTRSGTDPGDAPRVEQYVQRFPMLNRPGTLRRLLEQAVPRAAPVR